MAGVEEVSGAPRDAQPALWQKMGSVLDARNLQLRCLPSSPSFYELLEEDPPVTRLELKDNLLAVLDARVCTKLSATLTYLDLSGNKFSALGQELAHLSHLSTVLLRGNVFEEFPVVLLALASSLRYLDLGKNSLGALPEDFGRLSHLTTLLLDCNPLPALPASIGELRGLEALNLWGCALSELPESISRLESLRALDLKANALATFPPELTSLVSLQELDLGSNELRSLPPEISCLRRLKVLNVYHNRLEYLPPELSLCPLTAVFFNRNPLIDPPASVASAGGNVDMLLTYLRGRLLSPRPPPLDVAKMPAEEEGCSPRPHIPPLPLWTQEDEEVVTRRDEHGRTYFVDHRNKTTSWVDPREPLPDGWRQHFVEKNGRRRAFYVHRESNTKTWHDPRKAIQRERDLQQLKRPGTSSLKPSRLDIDEVQCPLCLEILINVVTTPCGHSFCKSCIDDAVRHLPMCPLCRCALPRGRRGGKVNQLLERLLAKSFPMEYQERKREEDLKKKEDLWW